MNPKIIHVISHGTKEGYLEFEKDDRPLLLKFNEKEVKALKEEF